jgi:formylglycine-generating enzyme required for sulfatase activity
MNRPLRVFICHSSNDKPAVRELYQKLHAEPWIQPWLDEEELYPGQDWNMEIEKAIEETDVIIVCLSKGSTTKEGYVQKEIRAALDYADYKPDGTLFIIPVRLEECTPPKRLGRWQYADYFEGQRERALQRLLVSLRKRADTLNLYFEKLKLSLDEVISLLDQVDIEHLNSGDEEFAFSDSIDIVEDLSKIIFPNGMEFMRVSAGKFLMGSKDDNELAGDNEKPQHFVDIPYDYWVARYPVTNEQYNLFVEVSGKEHPIFGWEYKKDHPVVYITRDDAMKYIKWINNLLKKELPSGLVLRLPTEKEWEKASRWVDGREYPWGTKFDKNKCNSSESRKNDTTPVQLYSPHGDSPYGCSDMVGNIWEWTCSEYKKYSHSIDIFEDKKILNLSAVRGGSFMNTTNFLRCAARDAIDTKLSNDIIGFRMCLAPPLPK